MNVDTKCLTAAMNIFSRVEVLLLEIAIFCNVLYVLIYMLCMYMYILSTLNSAISPKESMWRLDLGSRMMGNAWKGLVYKLSN